MDDGVNGDRLDLHVADEGTSLDVDALVAGVAAAVPGTEVYLCGPIRLMDAVRHAWAAAGLPPANLRLETFGNSGSYAREPFTVRVPRLDLEVTVPPDTSLLEALEQSGADVMFDCREGECGLCTVRVLGVSGTLDHRDVFLSEAQRSRGDKMCTCVSRVACAPDDRGLPSVTIDLP